MPRSSNIRRLLGEGSLIVASVFVAIALESWWDERSRAAEAEVVLGQVLEELRLDRADLEEVLAEQDALDGLYRDLIRWFVNPGVLPTDSVSRGLDSLAYSNRTMYPRRAGWSTMVAGNQTGLLGDSELITQLGDFYENINIRLVENGGKYDDSLFATVRESLPAIWDPHNRTLVTVDAREIAEFRSELHFLRVAWNEWYREMLRDYGRRLDDLIVRVEDRLT